MNPKIKYDAIVYNNTLVVIVHPKKVAVGSISFDKSAFEANKPSKIKIVQDIGELKIPKNIE